MTSANGGGAPVTHVQQLIEDTLDTNELTYSRRSEERRVGKECRL